MGYSVFAGAVSLGFAYVYFHMIKIHKLYHVSFFCYFASFCFIIILYDTWRENQLPHLVAMFIIIVGLVMLETHQGILT